MMIDVSKELMRMGVEKRRIDVYLSKRLDGWRRVKEKGERKWPHIEIGGDCLRIGKTTAKQVLVEQLGRRGMPFVFSDEDWKSNPFLEESYGDSSEKLLLSQIWFARKKRNQLNTLSEESWWIQVVNPEMDFNYAMTNYLLGRLSDKELEEYISKYELLGWKEEPAPDLLIYLKAELRVLMERFKKTARTFEKVEREYIGIMQAVNEDWLGRLGKRWPVLIVDTTDFDFSYKSGTQRARDEFGKKLFKVLKDLGWGW